MEFDELFTKLKVNPLKLIESIVHADGSSVILFKNRKSEILYVNDQFYQKHPQFKKIAVDNKKIPRKRWGISCE